MPVVPSYCQILGLVWNVSYEWSRQLLVFKKVREFVVYSLRVLILIVCFVLMRKHLLDDRNLSISADS
jgi:hypothetical protein